MKGSPSRFSFGPLGKGNKTIPADIGLPGIVVGGVHANRRRLYLLVNLLGYADGREIMRICLDISSLICYNIEQ